MMKKSIIVTENINCIYQVNRGDIILIKLVRKVEWELPESPKTEMYMYGEASVEANQEMQEPLEKLYQCENKLKELERILMDLVYSLESNTDATKNFVMASDVFEYTDAMWKVLEINNTKEKREETYEEMLKWD